MNIREFQLGELVYSLSGRDEGRYYLVLAVEHDSFVRLVDGVTRKVDNPKRKNWKHVLSTGQIAWDIAEKLGSNKRPTNSEVRKAIANLGVILDGDSGSKEVGE
jgi:ribosomal protein L14E/L6E/L27E